MPLSGIFFFVALFVFLPINIAAWWKMEQKACFIPITIFSGLIGIVLVLLSIITLIAEDMARPSIRNVQPKVVHIRR